MQPSLIYFERNGRKMSTVDLSYPELLPTETIIEILLQRRVKLGLDTMSRERLLEVYNKFCLPQTQRKPRDTARGRGPSQQMHFLHKTNEDYNENSITFTNKSNETDCLNKLNHINDKCEHDTPSFKRQKLNKDPVEYNADHNGYRPNSLKRKSPLNLEAEDLTEMTAKKQRIHTG